MTIKKSTANFQIWLAAVLTFLYCCILASVCAELFIGSVELSMFHPILYPMGWFTLHDERQRAGNFFFIVCAVNLI